MLEFQESLENDPININWSSTNQDTLSKYLNVKQEVNIKIQQILKRRKTNLIKFIPTIID